MRACMAFGLNRFEWHLQGVHFSTQSGSQRLRIVKRARDFDLAKLEEKRVNIGKIMGTL